MEAKSLLKSAINTIDDREPTYGDRNLVYDRTAIIANTVLGLSLSSYDIMMILHAAKLARIGGTQDKVDNYLDGVNYLAFACEAKFGGVAGASATSIVDDGIAEFARKFAPASTSSYEPHPGTVASTFKKLPE
jgi:hypothetical protein